MYLWLVAGIGVLKNADSFAAELFDVIKEII